MPPLRGPPKWTPENQFFERLNLPCQCFMISGDIQLTNILSLLFWRFDNQMFLNSNYWFNVRQKVLLRVTALATRRSFTGFTGKLPSSCNYIWFTKLPWPGGSEGTFQSSSQAATCPPVYHTRWRLHTVALIAERQAGKLWIPIFIVFGLTRLGIESKSAVSVADALSTWPLIG